MTQETLAGIVSRAWHESSVCYNAQVSPDPRDVLRHDHRPRQRPTRRVPFSWLVKAGFFACGVPANAGTAGRYLSA